MLPVALCLTACSGADGAHFKTVGEIPSAPRRPDGVAIDPASATPAARDRANASDSLVTLRSPLGADVAMSLVADFFRKVVIEDDDSLSALFTKDAIAITGASTGMGGSMGQTPQAPLWWEQRFRRLDYGKMAGEVIYRETELEIYRAADVIESPPHRAIRTDSLNESDVILRAPIATSRVGQERFFGDQIIFWLRRDGDHYKIFRLLEEFQIP